MHGLCIEVKVRERILSRSTTGSLTGQRFAPEAVLDPPFSRIMSLRLETECGRKSRELRCTGSRG
jgi:hypothetical protein